VIALELDGLVEGRQGSGVYVLAKRPRGGKAGKRTSGPSNSLRRAAPSKASLCARCGSHRRRRASGAGFPVAEMQAENARDVVMSEDADRRFHLLIAKATRIAAWRPRCRCCGTRARAPRNLSC
jgi:DNA-binding FadR family transcriptional regulator